jgi:hypothetical protein
MVTQGETDQAGQTTAPSRQTRLRRYLARRGRQLLRVLIGLIFGLLIAAALLEIYRSSSLIGLPDVGDPFDMALFDAGRVPPEQDAFEPLRKAQAKLTQMPSIAGSGKRGGSVTWAEATPELRDWLAANRGLLETFWEASERPDATLNPVTDRGGRYYFVFIGGLARLVFLEASRLEALGDMEEAWSLYRSVLRVKVHVMRRGSIFQRYITDRNFGALRTQIASWAADSRTEVLLLRHALDDVKKSEPRPEWDASSLKLEYMGMMTELDAEYGIVRQGDGDDTRIRIWGEELAGNLKASAYAVRRYVRHEPERSRRVLRLVFANWLAHAEEKDPSLQKPALRVIFGQPRQETTLYFFPVAPDKPEAARRMSPDRLAEWLFGTLDARLLLSHLYWPAIRTTERREHHELVLMLAREIYKREHNAPPASDQALIGPYLDHLPDDGSGEVDDGKAPTLSNSPVPIK